MGDLIEGLGEIEIEDVEVVTLVDKLGHFLQIFEKIREAGASRNESMLSSVDQVMFDQMLHYDVSQHGLEDPADDRSQTDRSVVGRVGFGVFLEKSTLGGQL